MCVCFLLYWHFCRRENGQLQRKITKVFENNTDLFGGVFITAIIGHVFESSTRITSCIIWTVYNENNTGNFLAVWLPQIFLFLFGTSTTLVFHIITCCSQWQQNSSEPRFNRILSMFTSKVHIFLVIHFITFGLLYSFLPAVILTFVYPTRMIVIFTFILAYFFGTTIIFAITINFFWPFQHGERAPNRNDETRSQQSREHNQENTSETNGNDETTYQQSREYSQETVSDTTGLASPNEGNTSNCTKPSLRMVVFFVVLMLACLFTFFIYAIVVTFLYLLIIGRGAVVNNVPFLLISLLPPTLISLGGWIIKRIFY